MGGLIYFLESIGILIMNCDGSIRATCNIIRDVHEIWDMLSERQKEIICELVGGNYFNE